ncbi:MAG: glycosyltransferase [Candidatus Limnocylindria bacterium]
MTGTEGLDGRQRLLLVSMYPLDRGLWGATTRITQLRDALARRVDLDVISGLRASRARGLATYLAGGRARGLAGIYVENATTLPGPADLAFLAVARARGIPILTYVRDAQQLFPEYYEAATLKRRLSRLLFLPATRTLMRLSTTVAFPSRGLADVVLGDQRRGEAAPLLPPGARLAEAPPVDPTARGLLFVGSLRYPAHGGAILLEAMELVRARGNPVELICVARAGDEPPGPLPSWLRVVRAEHREIDALLPGVLLSITPRRKTPYNDLAVPIKVMEYLGYGRPLVVTDTTETAAIVRAAQCGVVVTDTAEGLADGIALVAAATTEQIEQWGAAARRAAATNSWDARAESILQLLSIPG